MAVGFPSGLHSQRCPDHENLSNVLEKRSALDANARRLACPALTSANANAANDSIVTVPSFRQLNWDSYSVIICVLHHGVTVGPACSLYSSNKIYLLLE